MKFPRLRAFLVLLCSIGCAAAPLRADPIWGVNGHPFTAYPGISFDRQLDLLVELKLNSYRVDVTSLGQLERLGDLIQSAKGHGVTILPILIPPVDLKTETVPSLYAEARRFAESIVARFKGDVKTWELGNELENFAIIKACEIRDDGSKYPCEWGPAGGIGKLDYVGSRYEKVAAVLRGLSDGVYAMDPKARRAMGSAGWGHTGIFARLRDSKIDWDISVWHMYGGDSEWAFKVLATFNKPIWVTEFNHPLGSSKDGEQAQADGVEQQMNALRALSSKYNIEAGYIYELLDEAYWAPSFEAFMGLAQLRRGTDGKWEIGNRKIAFETVRRVITLDGE